MNGKRIAIACQGGGSQCAFVAGALKTLLARGIHRQHHVVGLSGTSGGAITAALAWVGLLREANGDETPIPDEILAFWRELSAQGPTEIFLDQALTQLLRMTLRGVLPSFASGPSSIPFQLWTEMISRFVDRPEFTDLRTLLLKHIDFAALPSLMTPESPVLLVGACDVQEGSFKVFSSKLREICVESLLASAAIPTLFPAVEVGGRAYWDGIFSSNPPVIAFLQKALMGNGTPLPQEIWIIQVNPTKQESIPRHPDEISDRRNHLAGNLSLNHELELIDIVNLLLEENEFTDRFRARMGLDATERLTVRFIRMSPELQRGLDYPSKLSREPRYIERLLADGEARANAFLDEILPEAQPLAESPERVRVWLQH